jgi:hypothetical protein
LVGKPGGSGQLQKPRHTWGYRIILKMDLIERGWRYVDWINLV